MNTTKVTISPAAKAVNEYLDATIGAGERVVADDFIAHMRERSGQNHEQTGQPLRRMAVPGALRRHGSEPDGRNAVLLYMSKSGLMLAAPGMEPVKATGSILTPLEKLSKHIIVALDSRSAATAQAMCERDERSKELASKIEVQRHMDVSSKLMILDRALNRTFWAPDEKRAYDIAYWCDLFGVTNDPSGWTNLAGACMFNPSGDGVSRYNGLVTTIYKREESMENSLGKRASSIHGASLFNNQTTVTEAWDAICRIDPLLRPLYIASGEVVELINPSWMARGGSVQAGMSSPCRLRVGSVLVCFDDGTVSDVSLSGMDFDDRLIGVFSSRGSRTSREKKTRSSASSAWQVLQRLSEPGGRVYATAAPFLADGKTSWVKRWSSERPEDMPVLDPIDLPVDIAIAGAPDA